MWEVWVRDAKSGAPIERVFPVAFPWSSSINGKGSATATFKINDAENPLTRDQVWSLFLPNNRLLSLQWGDYVAFAGKIDGWKYNRKSQTVVVSAVDLWNEWDWRLTYGVSGYLSGSLAVSNRTHSGAVATILNRGMQWGPLWVYPIDLPADAPGTFSAMWEYWRKMKISDLLNQVRDEGYEIYLRPYIASDGNLRFQTRVAPQVTVGTSSFHIFADESPLSKVEYELDGSRQLTGLQGLGNGTGQDQDVAWAGAGVYTIPIRDAKQDFADLTGARLQAATNAALAADVTPLVQWSIDEFTIDPDVWTPEHAEIGRVWQVEAFGDAVIPDGTYTLRVIAAGGDLSMKIRTEIQSGS